MVRQAVDEVAAEDDAERAREDEEEGLDDMDEQDEESELDDPEPDATTMAMRDVTVRRSRPKKETQMTTHKPKDSEETVAPKSRAWTPERRAKFKATMAKKQGKVGRPKKPVQVEAQPKPADQSVTVVNVLIPKVIRRDGELAALDASIASRESELQSLKHAREILAKDHGA